MRDDGRFYGPIVLIAGDLQMPFDELKTLEATVTTVTPLLGNDESLRGSVEVAKEFLKLSGLSTSPAVTEGLTNRVREAWNGGKRAVPPGYLDAQVERALLEQRAYQRRSVLGGKRLRALFHFASPPQGVTPPPVYLPVDVAEKLPMYSRFKTRVIARVHLPLDQYEQSAWAIEALALARLVATPRRPS